MAGAAALAAALWGCGPAPGDDGPERSGDRAAAEERTRDTLSTPDTLRPGGAPACPDTVPHPDQEATMEDTLGSGPTIHDVLERHRDAWMERPDVIGTGVGRCDGDPCLVIYLRGPVDEVEAELPDCVEGYRVRLEETGTVTPRDGEDGG